MPTSRKKTLVRRSKDFVYWRLRRLIVLARHLLGHAGGLLNNLEGNLEHRVVDQVERDPRIRYPCHKTLDEYIDVERLRALDADLKLKVTRIIEEEGGEPFDTGLSKLKLFGQRTGRSVVIPLTRSAREFSYFDLDEPGLWKTTEHVEEFADLWAFIQTLPFEHRTRVTLFADLEGRAVASHRDHFHPEICHEFIWLRTNLTDKPFFLYDRKTKQKDYLEGYSAWFDTVNQFHGCDETGRIQISLRVDGRFTEAFRSLFARPEVNPASTPALWACS